MWKLGRPKGIWGGQALFLVLGILLALLLVLTFGVEAAMAGEAGTATPAFRAAYQNVTAATLKAMLERKDFFLVNVHIPYAGEIAATDAFVPYDKVEQQLHLLPSKKDAKIVLYCQSGRMSEIAAQTLGRLGYINVWNLEGGMVGWRAKGYPLIQQEPR